MTTIKDEAEKRVKELLEQQEAALEAGNVAEARERLEEARSVLDKLTAWRELCDKKRGPESYEQLSEKLEAAAELVGESSQTELRQLRAVFEWCRDQGISLDELKVKDYLPLYREAASYLNWLCNNAEKDDASKLQEVQEALARIQSAQDRQAVRAWVRRPGQQGKPYDVGELR